MKVLSTIGLFVATEIAEIVGCLPAVGRDGRADAYRTRPGVR